MPWAVLTVPHGGDRVLQVEVHRLVWFVGILAFTVAMILFVIGLIRKMDPLNAFVNGFILVVVANVPEVSCRTHLP
jgi:magnesium-transporting ATPase (P-type)